MRDPILERIWKAQDSLLKKHGGWDSYFKYVPQVHEEHERKRKKRKSASAKKRRRRRATPAA